LISSNKKLCQIQNLKDKTVRRAPGFSLHYKTLKIISDCQKKPKLRVIGIPSRASHCSLAGILSGHAPLVKSGPGKAKERLF